LFFVSGLRIAIDLYLRRTLVLHIFTQQLVQRL